MLMMVYNDKKIDTNKILAISDGIYVESKDKKIFTGFNFKNSKTIFIDMELNKKTDIIDQLHIDITLVEDKIWYLFSLKESEVFLTKISDNKYRFEVDIKNPKIIFTLNENKNAFKNLKIDEEISFDFDYKPQKNKEMLNKQIGDHNFKLTDILNKL